MTMESISRLGMAVCAISAIVGSVVEGVNGEKIQQNGVNEKLPPVSDVDRLPSFSDGDEKLASFHKHESRKRVGDIFNQRELQVRNCNEQFAVATTTEILEMIEMFLGSELETASVASAITTIAPALRYDIAVIKVCLSCSQVGESDLEAAFISNGSPYGFPNYCSEGTYGYNAMHSALVFAPIDPATNQIVSGVLRGYLHGHDTEINVNEAPTDRWPDSLANALQSENNDEFFYNFRNSISSALAASAGAISISPDYIGYGEARASDRVYLAQLAYKQAFAVSYLATKRYLSTQSNGCSLLEDVVTVAGYGEGGYGAIYGALALEQIGVEILSAHAGGTPWDLDTQIGFLLTFIDDTAPEDIPDSLSYIPAYLGYGYSNGFPFLANTNFANAALIKSIYLGSFGPNNNIRNWFGAPNPLNEEGLDGVIPPDQIDLFNANIVQVYTLSSNFFNRLDGCRHGNFVQQGNTPKYCDAVSDNSIRDNGLNDISFDVSVCHSADDEVITIDQIPSFGGNIKEYVSMIPDLAPSGDHDTSAFVSCAMDPTFAFASADPNDPNSPVFISQLVSAPAQCSTPASTSPPTLGPTSASAATQPPTQAPTVGTVTPPPTQAPTVGTVTPPPTQAPTVGTVTPPPTQAPTVGTVTPPPTQAPTVGTVTPPPTQAPTVVTVTPPPTQAPTVQETTIVTGISNCAKTLGLMDDCTQANDCCDSGLICTTRIVTPTMVQVCSSQYVRARAKRSVGITGRGGRAGVEKTGDPITIGSDGNLQMPTRPQFPGNQP